MFPNSPLLGYNLQNKGCVLRSKYFFTPKILLYFKSETCHHLIKFQFFLSRNGHTSGLFVDACIPEYQYILCPAFWSVAQEMSLPRSLLHEDSSVFNFVKTTLLCNGSFAFESKCYGVCLEICFAEYVGKRGLTQDYIFSLEL